MAEQSSVIIKLGYTNTDQERQITFNDVLSADLAKVKERVLAINASLESGTDGGMKDFFRSDDYDASDSDYLIGQLKGITYAAYEIVEETKIM